MKLNRRPTDSALRAAALVAHLLLAAPLFALFGLAVLALLLQFTGTTDDAHGFATAMALGLGVLVIGPCLAMTVLIRRWWNRGGWRALLVADLALAAIGLFGLLKDPQPPSIALLLLAATAATLLTASGARAPGVGNGPMLSV